MCHIYSQIPGTTLGRQEFTRRGNFKVPTRSPAVPVLIALVRWAVFAGIGISYGTIKRRWSLNGKNEGWGFDLNIRLDSLKGSLDMLHACLDIMLLRFVKVSDLVLDQIGNLDELMTEYAKKLRCQGGSGMCIAPPAQFFNLL